jgi:hypothetical protein
MNELVKNFQNALAAAKSEPKGVKVGPGLWIALKAAELIQLRGVAAWGVFDLGFEMPFYKDICLIYDPELDETTAGFRLPPAVL